MGGLLIQLLPPLIGSLAMPSWVLLILALLGSDRGVVKAAAVVGGTTSVRLVQGIIFGIILSAYEIGHQMNAKGAYFSILLIVLGVLMWLMAVHQAFQKADLKLMSMAAALTPVRALGLGALLVVTSSRCWIFTLAALGIIEQAELDIAQSVVAYILYMLGAQMLLIAPILVSVRSSAHFEAATRWLEKYNRPIVIVVSVAVGCFFLWRGITGLIR